MSIGGNYVSERARARGLARTRFKVTIRATHRLEKKIDEQRFHDIAHTRTSRHVKTTYVAIKSVRERRDDRAHAERTRSLTEKYTSPYKSQHTRTDRVNNCRGPNRVFHLHTPHFVPYRVTFPTTRTRLCHHVGSIIAETNEEKRHVAVRTITISRSVTISRPSGEPSPSTLTAYNAV